MRVCLRCQKATYTLEALETDRTTNKMWLVYKCTKCGFNMELEEWADDGKPIDLKPEPKPRKYPHWGC